MTNFHAVTIVSSLSAVELLKTRSFAAALYAQHSAQCSASDDTTIALTLCVHVTALKTLQVQGGLRGASP